CPHHPEGELTLSTQTRTVFVLFLSAVGFRAQAQKPAGMTPSPAAISLDDAVREALDRNLDILAERYNLTLADTRIITARLRPNPVVSVGGDHLDLLGTGYNSENMAGPAEYSIRTDFVLERGGKRESRIAVAENGRAVVALQLLNSARTLIL